MYKKQLSDILVFLNNFKNRKGGYVFLSIILNKVFGFLLSLYVINQLTTSEFGYIAYSYNIISFIIPFAGFGIFQSLSRYGPIQESQNKKRSLFKFVLYRGILASFVLIVAVIIFATLLPLSIPESYNYLILISFLILSLFIFEVIKIYYRVFHLNKLFAYIEISQSIILLVAGVILTYFWGGYGYILVLILNPLILGIYIIIKNKLLLNIEENTFTNQHKRFLWIYGVYTSLGGVTSKLIFSIDILTIGYLLKDSTSVGLYKVASLIPFALLFIPSGVMQTDLAKITQQYENKAFLKQYASNYIKLFLMISIGLFAFLYFTAPYLVYFFGTNYSQAATLIPVFAFGLIGAFIFRIPFGNILTGIGWAKTNTLISIITLILDVVLNYFWVKEYGIIGAAYSTSLLLWLSGILSYFTFRKYLNTLD
ncbi:MAG: oligosaccharide flippase family protein [Flavobacteriales bacterium]|nr:oligosaccharide flippase family protein [Flavobacteriales bacterium]MCB9363302.1 oligosaccharide flippase family protein [Flavobacteriales bacterium]